MLGALTHSAQRQPEGGAHDMTALVVMGTVATIWAEIDASLMHLKRINTENRYVCDVAGVHVP